MRSGGSAASSAATTSRKSATLGGHSMRPAHVGDARLGPRDPVVAGRRDAPRELRERRGRVAEQPDLGRVAASSWPASMSTRIDAVQLERLAQAPAVELGELGAGEQHRVGVAQDAVDGREAQRRAEAQRVVVVDRAAAVDRQADGRAEPPGDLQRGVAGVGGAAAEQDQRALRRREARRRRVERLRVGDRRAGGRGDRHASRRRRRRAAARRAGSRCAPAAGGPRRRRPSARPSDRRAAPPGRVTVWLNAVTLREQALLVGQVVDLAQAAPRARHDAGDHEHRDRVVVGLGDRRERVRHAGPGDERGTRPGAPVTRAQPSAMKPAPCSWRGVTWRMPDSVSPR